MKLLNIIGARPQFIKYAPICVELTKHKDIKNISIHTGQHYDENMSSIFFEELKLPKPDYQLDFGNLSNCAMVGKMMEKIEKILLKEKPDIVLVYGDTNSTLAGTIAARKLNLKIAHVEAGLRSFNFFMQEEINRVITDRISDLLFCPTKIAVKNLRKERIDQFGAMIYNTGDVMLDAINLFKPFLITSSYLSQFKDKNFVLATVHRAENTDSDINLKNIFEALQAINVEYPVILPLHPRTHKKLIDMGFNFDDTGIIITPPVGYLEMLWLLDNCQIVVTDSGGLQKEAYFFHKPCIVLREETEWTELIQQEVNSLAGNKKYNIIKQFFEFKKREFSFDKKFYGNGRASEKIVDIITTQ